MMTPLDTQIEAILFFRGTPVRTKELAETLSVSKEEIEKALSVLKDKLTDRGLQLVKKDDFVLLTTTQEVSTLIEKIKKEELEKDLGKAGLETLSIILYRGPVTRAEIDYIRGVNSSYMLRTLLIRGLVERSSNPRDKRSHIYKPTFELLQYLGISNVQELPEYETVQQEMQEFVNQQDEQEK